MARAGGAFQILVINPGSTSTKLSLYRDDVEAAGRSYTHAAEELRSVRIADQLPLRLAAVERFLEESATAPAELDAAIGRGGLLRPIESGVYRVTDAMLADLAAAAYGEHACNLGAILAHRIGLSGGCPAYVADPVVVDEMAPAARLSGMPEIERRSVFHALNQKSAAREVARRIGRRYEECNFIVAHLGGGISVGAHEKGRVVDVNNALDGEGPFSPERSGGVPAGQLVDLCFGGAFGRAEIRRKITGGGGLAAYCGTFSLEKVLDMAESGDERAELALEAMAYQVSKEIAMHGATLRGQVDRIVLTGGMARSAAFIGRIIDRVSFLSAIEVVPGEREMEALAANALAALRGELVAKDY